MNATEQMEHGGPENYLVILMTQKLLVITFINDKGFGLVCLGQGDWRGM